MSIAIVSLEGISHEEFRFEVRGILASSTARELTETQFDVEQSVDHRLAVQEVRMSFVVIGQFDKDRMFLVSVLDLHDRVGRRFADECKALHGHVDLVGERNACYVRVLFVIGVGIAVVSLRRGIVADRFTCGRMKLFDAGDFRQYLIDLVKNDLSDEDQLGENIGSDVQSKLIDFCSNLEMPSDWFVGLMDECVVSVAANAWKINVDMLIRRYARRLFLVGTIAVEEVQRVLVDDACETRCSSPEICYAFNDIDLVLRLKGRE